MRRALLVGCVGLGAVVAWTSGAFGNRVTFAFAPGQSWSLTLGRGSGQDGLETVTVDSGGRAMLHRRRPSPTSSTEALIWEACERTLPEAALAQLRDVIASSGVCRLRRTYSAGVHDGTQWVLNLRQGDRTHAVYFDNRFPAAVRRLAAVLDEVVTVPATADGRWDPVLAGAWGAHDRALWASLRE